MLKKGFYFLKLISGLGIISLVAAIWDIKANGIILNDTSVNLDGNLFFAVTSIFAIAILVIYLTHLETANSRLARTIKLIVCSVGLALAVVIIYNVFNFPKERKDFLWFHTLEGLFCFEISISFFAMLLLNLIGGKLGSRFSIFNILKHNHIAVYVLVFVTILAVPAGINTYQESKACNVYTYEFSSDVNLKKYEDLYEHDDGYTLIEKIDAKMLLVKSIVSDDSEIKRFNSLKECQMFIDKKIVNENEVPDLNGSVPHFDKKKMTMSYHGLPNREIIIEAKDKFIDQTFPWAIFGVLAVLLVDIIICCIKMKKME